MSFVTRYSPAGCLKAASLLTGGLAILLGLALCSGVRGLRKEQRERLAQLAAQGYVTQTGDVIRLDAPLAVPTIFFARSVELQAGSAEGLAIFSQSADLYGTFAGPVFFAGQTLIVHRASTLLGGLELRARNVRIEGELVGEPKGTWQFLRREPLADAPVATALPPASTNAP